MRLLQLLPVWLDLLRFGKLAQTLHVDRDGKIPDVGVVVAEPDPAFPVIHMSAGQMRLTGPDEVQGVLAGLKAKQVHRTQPFEDRPPHF